MTDVIDDSDACGGVQWRRSITALLCVWLWWPGAALAETVAHWLDRMSHSHRELSYSGVISYQSADRMGAYRVVHGVENGREFEKIEPLDGGAEELVRLGHPVSCIHAGHQLLRFGDGDETNGLLGSLQRYYDVALGETTRIAERNAQQLIINPRDVYRYGYHLALDIETGLMLSSTLVNHRGQPIERFQYVQLALAEREIAPSRSAHVQPVHSPHGLLVAPGAAAAVADKLPWLAGWLPAGFVLAETENDPVRGYAQTFTDGLSVMSVFMEPAQQPVDAILMREGATASYTRALQQNGRHWMLTVVGELPDRTVQQVASSVRWR